jgi:hypothetical protein
MPRAPRHSKTSLLQSSQIAAGVSAHLAVLKDRHPHSPALTAASRLFDDFRGELAKSIAAADNTTEMPSEGE